MHIAGSDWSQIASKEQACIRIRDALFTREYLGEQVPKSTASSVNSSVRYSRSSRQDIDEQMSDGHKKTASEREQCCIRSRVLD